MTDRAGARGTRDFASRVLAWFDAHGRRDLPWQRAPTPYRVWVSEIMLQQTRVPTVRRYFTRFTERFPDIASLAAAPIDEVLSLWTGIPVYKLTEEDYRNRDKWGEYGPEKLRSMFAHKTFLDAGIPVAPASDYMPGPYEPMMALQSMVTRTDFRGNEWGPKRSRFRSTAA